MSTPPETYRSFVKHHPRVGEAYELLSKAAAEAGTLNPREIELVKLGISIGMQQEGAVHAHTRKALDAGCTPDDVRHAVLQAVTTLGFPRMMAAYTWVNDILDAR